VHSYLGIPNVDLQKLLVKFHTKVCESSYLAMGPGKVPFRIESLLKDWKKTEVLMVTFQDEEESVVWS